MVGKCMCGIVGIASIKNKVDYELLKTSSDRLHHRGPDNAGIWISSNSQVGLSHRRLSIIDTSSAGHQPMQDISNELIIVFNGEIYNFKELKLEFESKGVMFQNNTDTEVILAAYRIWGFDCLTRLNGMFTFAIYDKCKQQLFVARDRAGEKPLFYKISNGELLFASELKALMVFPSVSRTIDLEAFDCYLAMGYVPGDRCIIKDMKKLPPAHAMNFNLKNGILNCWQYWKQQNYSCDEYKEVDEQVLLDELESLLEDSVRRQLIADVPTGILLSGGVDSSLITAMAVRSIKKVKTFTIRFPGYDKYDETEHARLISNYFCTEHFELEATKSTVDIMPILARQFDEPIVDSSIIPTYLVSKLIGQHCTVALGGDGGDELFGGYQHYSRLIKFKNKFSHIPLPIRKMIAYLSEILLPVGFKGRNWLQGLGAELNIGLPLIAYYFDRTSRMKLMTKIDQWPIIAEKIWEQRIPNVNDLLQRASRMDFVNYLAEDILVKNDRASMLNSIELRAPFLDYRIIEFAFAKVPSRLKTNECERKILLKKLCNRVLPPEFNLQRKHGFSIPLERWLNSGPWHKFVREILLDSTDTFFDKIFINSLLEGQKKGYNNSERLFSLTMFELWCREYHVTLR